MQLHMSPMSSLPLLLSIVGDVQFTGSAPSEHVCETLFVSMAHSIFFQDVVLLRSATKSKGPCPGLSAWHTSFFPGRGLAKICHQNRKARVPDPAP